MKNFTQSVDDPVFKARLLDRLSLPKPFYNFKTLVDSSEYREDWFAFRRQAYIDWVKRQMETQD